MSAFRIFIENCIVSCPAGRGGCLGWDGDDGGLGERWDVLRTRRA